MAAFQLPGALQSLVCSSVPARLWRCQHSNSQARFMPAVGQLQASESLRPDIDESGLGEAVWAHLQWGHGLQASNFLSVLDDEVQATQWAQNRWWDETCTRVQLWELDSVKVLLETVIFRVNDLRTHFRLPMKRDTSGEYLVVNFIPGAACVNIREVGQPGGVLERENRAEQRNADRAVHCEGTHWVSDLHGYYDTDSECEESNLNDGLMKAMYE